MDFDRSLWSRLCNGEFFRAATTGSGPRAQQTIRSSFASTEWSPVLETVCIFCSIDSCFVSRTSAGVRSQLSTCRRAEFAGKPLWFRIHGFDSIRPTRCQWTVTDPTGRRLGPNQRRSRAPAVCFTASDQLTCSSQHGYRHRGRRRANRNTGHTNSLLNAGSQRSPGAVFTECLWQRTRRNSQRGDVCRCAVPGRNTRESRQ